MYRHVIEVEGRFVDNLTNKAEGASRSISGVGTAAKQAAKDVNKLGSSEATPDVGLDTSKFTRAMDKVNGLLNKFKKVHHAALNLKESNTYQRLKKITDTVEGLTRKTWSVIVKVKDIALSPFRAVRNALFSIQTLAATIFAGIAAKFAIINPINLADAYSSAQIGFSTLLGQSAGQQMMNKIDEFAKATPFKTSGVISNVQKMMAYGWDVDRVIKDMETIGDAAAATGKGDEGLSSIVYALSEIRSKGKLSTQELNQLASAGIKAKAYLAEGLGFGTDDEGMAELASALESGEIGANQAIDLILKGMEEFDGMMDKTANETVEGLISQIEDAFEISVVRKWGQGLQDGAKRGIGTVVELLDKAESALAEFGDMLYDIAKVASNWVADKFEKTISRILEITDTFEFKNASLKEKISMLWKGIVTDPLKEWWDGGGRAKTVETAGKIGAWMGKTLKAGLLAVFGITDILKGEDEDLGAVAEIAKSFSDGFRENFDASVVTDKLVEAIGNVWNALPAWAKILLVGYGGTKLAIGGMNLVSGIANVIGTAGVYEGGKVVGASGILGAIGKTGVYGVGGSGILGGLSKLGYGASSAIGGTAGKAALLGVGGGTAALAGVGTLVTAAGVIKSGFDFYDAYQAHKEGDKVTRDANIASGATTLAGAGIGAAIGTMILPGVGTLIGAGIGTAVGWFAGDKIAKNIEAAKFEAEGLKKEFKDAETEEEKLEITSKALYENAKRHFGDIALSASEISRISEQIVWGDDLAYFEEFTTATKTAKTSLQSLKNASAQTNKWMWKAGLNVKFNDDEKESIVASFDEYLASAQAYIENKHYEFSTSASMLLDLNTEVGKSILDSGNAFYTQKSSELATLKEQLTNTLQNALEDSVISAEPVKLPNGMLQLSEMDEIINLQEQIAKITEQLSDAETKAELSLIKVKLGKGNIDFDSFQKLSEELNAQSEARINAIDEAYKSQITSLELRFPDGGEEYEKQLQALVEGRNAKIEEVGIELVGFNLNMTSDAFAKAFGKSGSSMSAGLKKALENCINKDMDPLSIDDETLASWLNVSIEDIEASGFTADNIKGMLSDLLDFAKYLEIDSDLLLKIVGAYTYGDVSGLVGAAVDNEVPEYLNEDIILAITANAEIMNQIETMPELFGIEPTQMAEIMWKLSATKTIEEKLDIVAKEFGVEGEMREHILLSLTANPVYNKITLYGKNFLNNTSVTATPTVTIKPRFVTALEQNAIKEYRGGFVGGTSSAIEGFAEGGFVRGGARLITVAEEGTPEVIIPLGSHRRQRGLDLWMKAGEMLGVNGFDGGRLATGGRDEGIRHKVYGGGSGNVSNDVHIDMGGVHVSISVDAKGGENVVEAIKAQGNEIAEVVAGILADELGGQFENTPAKGGAA